MFIDMMPKCGQEARQFKISCIETLYFHRTEHM